MAGVSRRIRTDSHRSQGHGHDDHQSSSARRRLDDMKAQDQAVDIRIRTVKKVLAATKGFAKDLQALGLPKDDAARRALDLFELSLNAEDGHGGH